VICDCYDFLTSMYLKKSAVVEPPEDGWPDITAENLGGLGKTDEVLSLLRHLPYSQKSEHRMDEAQAAAWCYFADWQYSARFASVRPGELKTFKICSEDLYTYTPPQVIGLTMGGRDNPVYLLDTKLGVVYWPCCPGEITFNPSSPEQILDWADEYAPENEVEWRADASAWTVADFFEVLKNRFRELQCLPLSPRIVKDTHAIYGHHNNLQPKAYAYVMVRHRTIFSAHELLILC
jgi:hypothetical protein